MYAHMLSEYLREMIDAAGAYVLSYSCSDVQQPQVQRRWRKPLMMG